ncbi:MAG: sigma E protease regulator RseP [Gammaproteobacteria bacterium]|nr:sigma E protease regulator RseP [Gammaproteobacteria bacterium]
MAVVQQVLYFFLVLGVLITFHEYGHFWVARRCGIRVLRFSVGFGPALLRWHDRRGTEFVVAALPLGGYVKMLDEREGEVAESERAHAFNRKSVAQRIATVAAGPLANFALAVVAYWIVFALGVQGIAPVVAKVTPDSVAAVAGLAAGEEIVAVDGVATPTVQALSEMLVRRLGDSGTISFRVVTRGATAERELRAQLVHWDLDPVAPDPIGDIGIELYRPPIPAVVASVESGSPAAQAGMRAGDRILAANDTAIADWAQWVEYVRARPAQTIALVIERAGERRELSVTPKSITAGGETFGQVGVAAAGVEWPADYRREQRYGPVAALVKGVATTWDTAAMILESVRKMIVGDISVRHLSGPITIAKVAGASAQYGLVPLLQFMALLSVSFGVLNLLPIPVLDGGHLVYYALEAARGRPLSERIQEAGYRIGLSLVIGLMLLALYNDVSRF